MRNEYDFSGSVENPYVRKPHRQVTMNLDVDVIDYFKGQDKLVEVDGLGDVDEVYVNVKEALGL